MGGIAATNFISNAGLRNMSLATFIPGFRRPVPPDFCLAIVPDAQISGNYPRSAANGFKRTIAISFFASLLASGQATAQSPADDFSRRQDQQQQLQRLENLKQVTPDGVIVVRDKEQQAALEAGGAPTLPLDELNRDPDKAYEITKDKHVGLEVYLSTNSLRAAVEAGKTITGAFGEALDRMVQDGKRTPEQAALSKEIFPFLDDPKVQASVLPKT